MIGLSHRVSLRRLDRGPAGEELPVNVISDLPAFVASTLLTVQDGNGIAQPAKIQAMVGPGVVIDPTGEWLLTYEDVEYQVMQVMRHPMPISGHTHHYTLLAR